MDKFLKDKNSINKTSTTLTDQLSGGTGTNPQGVSGEIIQGGVVKPPDFDCSASLLVGNSKNSYKHDILIRSGAKIPVFPVRLVGEEIWMLS
jgi:hypothetical protein